MHLKCDWFCNCFQLHDRFCKSPKMSHLGEQWGLFGIFWQLWLFAFGRKWDILVQNGGFLRAKWGAIWHLLTILPFSSCTGWQAVSFEYLHGRFCIRSKMGHFGAKWGLFRAKWGAIWHLLKILPFSSCTGWQAVSSEYLHGKFCIRSKMGQFGFLGQNRGFLLQNGGAIWHLLTILPFSSCTWWKAVSYEYLHGRFCIRSKMGHFRAKWGLFRAKWGAIWHLLTILPFSSCTGWQAVSYEYLHGSFCIRGRKWDILGQNGGFLGQNGGLFGIFWHFCLFLRVQGGKLCRMSTYMVGFAFSRKWDILGAKWGSF